MKLDITLPEFCGTLWSEAALHLTSVPLSLKRISMGSQWGAGALHITMQAQAVGA